MKLSTQAYKGARDFYPEDKRLQNYIFEVWTAAVQRFGYEQYDAPLLEPLDLYRAKTGDEIVNEQVYSFVDRGDREVAIRPEMTPTVSRMVAGRRQELAYPLRWFSIPNLWRYERPQRGRLREHWQLNVDIFGEEGLAAEHEVIQVADVIMQEFGATRDMYEIRINSRKLLNERVEECGVKSSLSEVVRLIDNFEKLTSEEFAARLEKHVENPQKLLDFLKNDSDSNTEINDLLRLCGKTGMNVRFVPSLARGFDYYTDIVFEVFDTNPENSRSLFGGGRYDGLVGLFGVDPVPTVGFGMGDVMLANFLETHSLLPDLHSPVDLTVILIRDVYEKSQTILSELRKANLNISVDATDRKIDKKLKAADKGGARKVLFIGEDELELGKFTLKDLKSGKESKESLQQVVASLASLRGE